MVLPYILYLSYVLYHNLCCLAIRFQL